MEREVDQAYEKYKHHDLDCTLCNDVLIRALEKHAYAVAGSIFHRRRPDVVNEALMKAWKGMGKFRGESKFSTWFHRIVLNTCKQFGARETRERKREVPLSDTTVGQLSVDAISGMGRLDIREYLTREEWLFLLDKLSPMPDAEVAEKWGLSLSGVRGKWRRIKQKIQAALG